MDCNLFIIWYNRHHGGYLVRPSSGLSKPMSAYKCIKERLKNISRRCERSEGLLHSNEGGVVETDVRGSKD